MFVFGLSGQESTDSVQKERSALSLDEQSGLQRALTNAKLPK